jgi:hypothetical protein
MAKIETDVVAAVIAGVRDEQRALDAGPIRTAGKITTFALASRIADAVWGDTLHADARTRAAIDRFYDLADGVTV